MSCKQLIEQKTRTSYPEYKKSEYDGFHIKSIWNLNTVPCLFLG